MLIMDGLEIKKLALGGQEFIKKPEITDYWDYYVGTIIYDIALSDDENYLYIFYSTGIQKVDRKGKLIWTFDKVSGINLGTVTPDGYVVFAAEHSLYSIKDDGQSFSSFNVIGLGSDTNATALVSNSNSKVYVGLAGENGNSAIELYDLSNNGKEYLVTVDNPSGKITSLCLNSNSIIATSMNGMVFVFNLSTKKSKSIYPFTQSGSNDTAAFASCSEDKIVCSSGTSSELVLLDINLNVIKKASTKVRAFKSCLIINGYIYANSLNSSSSTYSVYKFDLDFNMLMCKIYSADNVSKLVYSEKGDALYMGHDAYYVGKFATYFA
ncbi:hypothetical protein [Levilactobacillus brevis]|uniref:hypothetical protein n=1 Tax=Levilactobacillus brevis TaxID=1580 RepID=UPI000B34E908|nr:hypothetical protein [Levilactobacillus brevis]